MSQVLCVRHKYIPSYVRTKIHHIYIPFCCFVDCGVGRGGGGGGGAMPTVLATTLNLVTLFSFGVLILLG